MNAFKRKIFHEPSFVFVISGQKGSHRDLNLALGLTALTIGREWERKSELEDRIEFDHKSRNAALPAKSVVRP